MTQCVVVFSPRKGEQKRRRSYMATTVGRLEEVRQSVKRIQAEGERFVGRLRQDARAMVERNRPEVLQQFGEDVRKRAQRALGDIQSQRARVVRVLEDVLARLRENTVRALQVPDLDRFDAVCRRLAETERRLAETERRLERLAAKKADAERAA